MKHLNVVAAILLYNGKILCMERGPGKYPYVSYKYEFPGGKIEPAETKANAIERELQEEMDIFISIKESDLFITVNHQYPDFSITMHAFKCYLDTPRFTCKEHISYKWLSPEDLPTLDWAAADIPIMEKLSQE